MNAIGSNQTASLSDRLSARIDSSAGPTACWNWRGCKTPQGYGKIGIRRRSVYVHRLSFELAHGVSIARDTLVCHRCDNPSCCNPAHLFLGTVADNVRDSVAKGRWGLNRGSNWRGKPSPNRKISDDLLREAVSASTHRGGIKFVAMRAGVKYGTLQQAVRLAKNGLDRSHVL